MAIQRPDRVILLNLPSKSDPHERDRETKKRGWMEWMIRVIVRTYNFVFSENRICCVCSCAWMWICNTCTAPVSASVHMYIYSVYVCSSYDVTGQWCGMFDGIYVDVICSISCMLFVCMCILIFSAHGCGHPLEILPGPFTSPLQRVDLCELKNGLTLRLARTLNLLPKKAHLRMCLRCACVCVFGRFVNRLSLYWRALMFLQLYG